MIYVFCRWNPQLEYYTLYILSKTAQILGNKYHIFIYELY